MAKKVLCIVIAVIMAFSTMAITSFAAVDYKDLIDRTFLTGRLKSDMTAIPETADSDEILQENLLYWDAEVQDAYNSAKTNEDYQAVYELMKTPMVLDDVEFTDTWYAHRDESYGKVSVRYVADKNNAEVGDTITVNAYLTTNFYTPNAAMGIVYDKELVTLNTISYNVSAFAGWTLVSKNTNYGYLANSTDVRSTLWPDSMQNDTDYATKGAAQIYLASNSVDAKGNYARKFNDELVFSATFTVNDGATDGTAITFSAPDDCDWSSEDIFDYYENTSSLFGFERVTENAYPYKAVDEMTFCDHIYTITGDGVSVGSVAYADYTAYNVAINKYNALVNKASNYTDDSWATLKNAATTELDANLTLEHQGTVDAVTASINTALAGLKVKGVLEAKVVGNPKINANANIRLTVNGSPTIVRLVDASDRANTITLFREDMEITSYDGYEVWDTAIYADKDSVTYTAYAKYSDGYSKNGATFTLKAGLEDDLTIHSMYISDMFLEDGETYVGNNGYITAGRHNIRFTTSTAVYKIQFIDSYGNTWTYSAANKSIYTDKDGERTWTISLNFYRYGNWVLGVRTRAVNTSFASGVGEDLNSYVVY